MRRLTIVSALALTACASSPRAATSRPATPTSTTSTTSTVVNTTIRPSAAAGDWRSLNTLSAWRGYKADTLPSGWREVNGMLQKSGRSDDIVTRDQFGNFEFEFEWKLEPGGNAGVFYRASEEYEKVYWSATEYQLLDNAGHPDGRNALTSAGAAYGLYAPPAGVALPAGEWNMSRIVANGAHVEHWLNGRKIVEYTAWSPDWEGKVAASKFKEWPHYGRAASGLLAIQGDHGGTLDLRNVRIRTLP